MPRHFRDYLAPFAVLLLLYAGYFKASPLLSWVPVDLTLLGALLTLVGVVAVLSGILYQGEPAPYWRCGRHSCPMAILHANNTYGSSKSLRLFTLTLLAALGPLFLIRSERRQQTWVFMQIALGAVLAIGTTLSPVPNGLQDYIYRQATAGADPIGAGRAAGVAVVGCFALALAGHRRRAWLTAAGAALIVPMFMSGSRGPVASAAAALAAVAVLAPGRGTMRAVRVAVIAAGMALTYALTIGRTTGGTGRIALTLLKGSDQDNASQLRLMLWHYTLAYLPGHPWGAWGGLQDTTGYVLLGLGLRYPHNVLLEVTAEAGWIAGAAVIVFLWAALRRLRAAAVSPFPAALFGIAVFFTLNAMVSGDVNDNRTMWASLAIGWVIASRDGTPRTSEISGSTRYTVSDAPLFLGAGKWGPERVPGTKRRLTGAVIFTYRRVPLSTRAGSSSNAVRRSLRPVLERGHLRHGAGLATAPGEPGAWAATRPCRGHCRRTAAVGAQESAKTAVMVHGGVQPLLRQRRSRDQCSFRRGPPGLLPAEPPAGGEANLRHA